MDYLKVRAARALLGWSQTELAERAGISLMTVSDCEKGSGKTTQETLKKLENAFRQESVWFTPYGVELRKTATYDITGPDWWLKVLDDVYYTLVDHDDAEVLFMFADDRESPSEVNDRIRKIRNAGIKMRQIVKEDNTYLMAPTSEYRWVPKEYFLNNVMLIYGEKIAICADNNTKATIFKDKSLALSWRNTFEMLWNGIQTVEPSRSTADERF